MKKHLSAAFALAVMAILALGSVDPGGDATSSSARTLGYSAVEAKFPGADAKVNTVDDVGNGEFHVSGRFTEEGRSVERGFYIVMRFEPGENDTADITEFDITE